MLFLHICTEKTSTALQRNLWACSSDKEESKKWEDSVRSSGHCPLCPGPRVPCETSQSARKGNSCRKLTRDASAFVNHFSKPLWHLENSQSTTRWPGNHWHSRKPGCHFLCGEEQLQSPLGFLKLDSVQTSASVCSAYP